MFGRLLLGLALCFNAVGADGGGGGAASPPAQPAAGASPAAGSPPAGSPPPATPPAPPAAPPVDTKKIEADARAAARAEFLKEQGFADEAAYQKHLKEKRAAEDAKLSEQERQKKLYDETLEAKTKAEVEAEKHKGEVKELRRQLELRDTCDKNGIKPAAEEREFVDMLLRRAKEADKAAGKTFDEAKFFADLRKERGYLFAGPGTAPAPGAPPPGFQPGAPYPFATLSPPAPAAPALVTTPVTPVDGSKLPDADWKAHKARLGLA
jgi:hypothetical protein